MFALRENDYTSVLFPGYPKRIWDSRCSEKWMCCREHSHRQHVLELQTLKCTRTIYINTCCVQGRNIITCLTQCGCRNALCYLLGYIYHWHQGYDSKSIHWASVFPAQSAKGKQNWLVADEGTSFPREDLSKQSHSQIYSKCTMLLLLKFHF